MAQSNTSVPRVEEPSGSPALTTKEDLLTNQLKVVVDDSASASMGEQVAATAAVKEVAVTVLSALC